jgi:hypothetical protein
MTGKVIPAFEKLLKEQKFDELRAELDILLTKRRYQSDPVHYYYYAKCNIYEADFYLSASAEIYMEWLNTVEEKNLTKAVVDHTQLFERFPYEMDEIEHMRIDDNVEEIRQVNGSSKIYLTESISNLEAALGFANTNFAIKMIGKRRPGLLRQNIEYKVLMAEAYHKIIDIEIMEQNFCKFYDSSIAEDLPIFTEEEEKGFDDDFYSGLLEYSENLITIGESALSDIDMLLRRKDQRDNRIYTLMQLGLYKSISMAYINIATTAEEHYQKKDDFRKNCIVNEIMEDCLFKAHSFLQRFEEEYEKISFPNIALMQHYDDMRQEVQKLESLLRDKIFIRTSRRYFIDKPYNFSN